MHRPGIMIAGRYKLLEEIGEGGMGSVWLAEQAEPVRRRVAIKLIKAGMDSRQVVSRFSAERQALALMDHPNIAKVFDGGITDDGRPFFVMEYVKGVSLTQYCDDTCLSIRHRLELLVQICQAVQHAHQKGVIHRDLKPSNILVCLYDGQPVPKVIDFGLAKAIGQPLTEQTLYTAHGMAVGTPIYMSPEQAEFNNLDIDTRTDVYSLGVILYELLTGTTPIEKQRFREAAWQEMLRLIKEESPKPSSRVSTSANLAKIAARRSAEPNQLQRSIQGDLDWIAMKALEKERSRRYETASSLARDIERYLHEEPIEARPPSTAYRLKKLAKKHRWTLAAVTTCTVLLAIGVAATTWQAIRATRAETLARANEQTAYLAAATANEHEAEITAVLDFVVNRVFAAARPEGQAGGLGKDVTLRDAVMAATAFIDTSFTNQPLIEARLRDTVGNSYLYLGEPRLAEQQLLAARSIYARQLGIDHPDTLLSTNSLARAYHELDRHDEALKLREHTLAQRKTQLGPDHPDTLQSMQDLATSFAGLERHDEALKLREQTLAMRKIKLGADHPDTLRSMQDLADSYVWGHGRDDEALKLREQTLAMQKIKLGKYHPDTLQSMLALASCYAMLGREEEALRMGEETLALQKTKLGIDHPDTLASMNNLSNSYSDLGRHEEALKLREGAMNLWKTKFGPDHMSTLWAMHSLGSSYLDVGRLNDALKLFEQTLALQKIKLGPNHENTLLSMSWILQTLARLDRLSEALPIIDDFLQRAAGKDIYPGFVFDAIDLRFRHFAKLKDPRGCHETALMWERLNETDADSLYYAACLRAITAGIFKTIGDSDVAAQQTANEAEQAMQWLRQAIDAGFDDADQIKEDEDLDVLRDRNDFQQILKRLEEQQSNCRP